MNEDDVLDRARNSDTPFVKFKSGLLDIIEKVGKFFSESWTLVTFFGTVLGLFTLYLYVKTIGRTDLFMASASVQASLFVWLFLVVLVSFAYMFILIATPSLFSLAVSMFGRDSANKRTASLHLIAPVFLGFFVFSFMVFIYPEGHQLWTVFWVVLTTALATAAAFCRSGLRGAASSALRSASGNGTKFSEKVIFGGLVWVLVFFTVLSGSSPALLAIRAYKGSFEEYTVYHVMTLAILTMTASLVPILVFHVSKERVLRRVFYSCLSLIAVFFFTVIISPGTLGMITYSAAGLLEIRQSETSTYIVGEVYKGAEFDKDTWGAEPFGEGRVYITAFPLYSFGDVLLLCPAGLKKTMFKDWPALSSQCFTTRNSDMRLRVPKALSQYPKGEKASG